MERMPDGRSDTMAEWKSDVFDLPDDQIRRYLAEVEHFTPAQIDDFCARGAAPTPEDWRTSDRAHDAMERLMAFMARVEPAAGPGQIDERGARGAALDADKDSGAALADTTFRAAPEESEDDIEAGVKDVASNYGGASLPPP